ncbi:MAG: hypothetical protein ACRDRA_01885 [Pseudonocardiaceae bacterium]
MPLDFRTKTVSIPSGTGRRSINDAVSFGSRAIRANVSVNGFQLDYVNADHHINIIEIDTDVVNVDGNDVEFRVECDYADKNFDDLYRGRIEVLVIAEVQ